MAMYLWVKRRRLRYYDTYDEFKEALSIAKYYQKKLKANYFILKYEDFLTGDIRYKLYMNKVYSFG